VDEVREMGWWSIGESIWQLWEEVGCRAVSGGAGFAQTDKAGGWKSYRYLCGVK